MRHDARHPYCTHTPQTGPIVFVVSICMRQRGAGEGEASNEGVEGGVEAGCGTVELSQEMRCRDKMARLPVVCGAGLNEYRDSC